MPDPSLIGRRSINTTSRTVNRGLGLLMVLAIIFVAVVLAVYGGVLGYKQTLQGGLDSASKQLGELQDKFQPDNIRKIAEVDRALSVARTLLSRHTYATNVFAFLQSNTLRDVRYKDFSFTASPSQITLATEVEGYVGLKRQIELLEESQLIRSAVFSSLNRSLTGTVSFSLVVTFEDNLLRFGAVPASAENGVAPTSISADSLAPAPLSGDGAPGSSVAPVPTPAPATKPKPTPSPPTLLGPIPLPKLPN